MLSLALLMLPQQKLQNELVVVCQWVLLLLLLLLQVPPPPLLLQVPPLGPLQVLLLEPRHWQLLLVP